MGERAPWADHVTPRANGTGRVYHPSTAKGTGDPAYYGNSAWSERCTSAQCRHPRVLVEGRARGNMHHVAQPAGTPAAQVLLNRGDDP